MKSQLVSIVHVAIFCVMFELAQTEDRATQRCDPSAVLGPSSKWGGWVLTQSLLFLRLRNWPNAINLRSTMLRSFLTGMSMWVRSGWIRSVSQSSIRALSPSWDSKRVRLPHLATSMAQWTCPVPPRAHLTKSRRISHFPFMYIARSLW